jgi:hypothetical protein
MVVTNAITAEYSNDGYMLYSSYCRQEDFMRLLSKVMGGVLIEDRVAYSEGSCMFAYVGEREFHRCLTRESLYDITDQINRSYSIILVRNALTLRDGSLSVQKVRVVRCSRKGGKYLYERNVNYGTWDITSVANSWFGHPYRMKMLADCPEILRETKEVFRNGRIPPK